MTDAELKAIANDDVYPLKPRKAKELAAEVLRLRGLIKSAEWYGGCGDMHESETGCPWCDSDGFYQSSKFGHGCHAEDCPAFTTTGEVR